MFGIYNEKRVGEFNTQSASKAKDAKLSYLINLNKWIDISSTKKNGGGDH